MKQPVDLPHASRLINHGPTVIVSAAHGSRRNLMAAAWSMPVEFTPPRIAVVIDKSTFTRTLVLDSGRFAINIPCRVQADLTFSVGSTSGRELPDKFAHFGIGRFDGPRLQLPLVEGCVAWLECRLIEEVHAQTAYDTFFGEVVSAQADARVFDRGRWSFRDDNRDLHTLHHLGAGVFGSPLQTVQARLLEGGRRLP